MPRVLVGAVVLLLALAGCGGDPKADPSPSPSVPSVSPVNTTPAPPALPEAARANTKAGAIAFVKYYIGLFNRAQTSGHPEEMASFSAHACDECNDVVAALAKIYGSGGHIDGGDLRAHAATADYNGAEDVWLVLIQIESGPQSVTTAAGATATSLPGGRRSMRFSVKRSGDAWKVAAWSRT